MFRCEGSRELKCATNKARHHIHIIDVIFSYKHIIYYVYPATSVTGSLNRELISVGDSVHLFTGPNEVSIITMASCWLVY